MYAISSKILRIMRILETVSMRIVEFRNISLDNAKVRYKGNMMLTHVLNIQFFHDIHYLLYPICAYFFVNSSLHVSIK
jgi:hypothetical protein